MKKLTIQLELKEDFFQQMSAVETLFIGYINAQGEKVFHIIRPEDKLRPSSCSIL